MLRVLSACVLAAVAMDAGQEIVWKPATVLHARYKLDTPDPGMPGALGGTVARGEFDFDAGDLVYKAREDVAPNTRLVLSPGDEVQIAIEKKALLLRIGKKFRKLKLVSTVEKRDRILINPDRN